jgi:hypothetical protein
MARNVALIVCLLVALGAPAFAQDKPLSFIAAVGPDYPTGNIQSTFGPGYQYDFGVTYSFNQKTGVQFDYQYGNFGGKQVAIASDLCPQCAPIAVGHTTHAAMFDYVYRLGSQTRGYGFYVLGGGGFYHRTVSLNSAAQGAVIWCDPATYVCHDVPTNLTDLLGSRSSNDFGINLGGGVSFRAAEHWRLFIEARWHYVFGPTVQGTDKKANGQYIPVTFGIRF